MLLRCLLATSCPQRLNTKRGDDQGGCEILTHQPMQVDINLCRRSHNAYQKTNHKEASWGCATPRDACSSLAHTWTHTRESRAAASPHAQGCSI